MVTSLSWRSNNLGALSILDASFKFALGSYLVSGEPWSTVRMEQRAIWVNSVFSAVNGVSSPASLRMHRKQSFAFAVREGCVSERTRFQSSSRSIGAQVTCAFAPPRRMPFWSVSSSDEDVMSPARRKSRRGLPRSVVATSGSLEIEIGGVRWVSFARKASQFSKHLPILYAVRYAESNLSTALDSF